VFSEILSPISGIFNDVDPPEYLKDRILSNPSTSNRPPAMAKPINIQDGIWERSDTVALSSRHCTTEQKRPTVEGFHCESPRFQTPSTTTCAIWEANNRSDNATSFLATVSGAPIDFGRFGDKEPSRRIGSGRTRRSHTIGDQNGPTACSRKGSESIY